MNPQNDEIEIDLRELLYVILRRIWMIAAVTVIGGVLAGLISYYMIVPKYKSTAQIYIVSNSESMISLSDLQMGSNLANDYQEMIKSRPVVEAVIEGLKLDMQYGEMLGLLSIENKTNTRILNITIEYTDPQVARDIANEFAEVSRQEISNIMKVDEPTFFAPAVVAKSKSSPNNARNALLGALAGFVLTVGIVVVLYIMDDTIKTSEDVEKYLGMNTLAAIPEEGGTDNKEKLSKKRKLIGVRK